MTPLPRARAVTRDDLLRVATTLARSFHDDPVLSWMLPDFASRPERLWRFFHAMLQHVHLRHGHVYATETMTAAAVWDPPGAWQIGLQDQARLAPAMLSVFRTGIPRVLQAL